MVKMRIESVIWQATSAWAGYKVAWESTVGNQIISLLAIGIHISSLNDVQYSGPYQKFLEMRKQVGLAKVLKAGHYKASKTTLSRVINS